MRCVKVCEPCEVQGGSVMLTAAVLPGAACEVLETWNEQAGDEGVRRPLVQVSARDLDRIGAREGDLLFLSHPGWWHGGLRGAHVRAGAPGGRGAPLEDVGISEAGPADTSGDTSELAPEAAPGDTPEAAPGDTPGQVRVPEWLLGWIRREPGTRVRLERIL